MMRIETDGIVIAPVYPHIDAEIRGTPNPESRGRKNAIKKDQVSAGNALVTDAAVVRGLVPRPRGSKEVVRFKVDLVLKIKLQKYSISEG